MAKKNGTTLANAYVQIMPSADGIKQQLTDLLGDNMPSGEDTGKKTGEGILGGIKSVVATGAKAAFAGITAAGGAVAALTKASVDSFADYEQLIGGVETLFDTAADKVEGYANAAYKTAGMNANAYMETVTGFSASLLQGLGGNVDLASTVANRAITDMADNANKMGSDMGSIQNAYQGFAKQNYTMLDNLKLGYGGTKEEMARLIADASKMTTEMDALGVSVDGSSMSFDNIINAISVVQSNLGITGTTAKEAGETISGSAASMQAAWQNVLTGIAAGDQDITNLITTAMGSTEIFAGNLVPRIQTALGGIGTAVGELVPELLSLLPGMVEELLPGLVDATLSLVTSVGSLLMDNAPALIQSGVDAAVSIIEGLASGAADNAHNFIDQALPMLMEFSGSLRENAGKLIDAALHLIVELGKGLIRSLPKLIETVPTIVSNIAGIINDNAPKLIGAALTLIVELGKGLINAIPTLVRNIPKIIGAIVDVISAFNWINLGSTIIKNLGSGISGMVKFAGEAMGKIAEALKGGVKNLPSALKTVGEDIVKGLWNGVSGMVSWVKSKFTGFASSIVSGVKSALGIHSPSRVFRDVIGKNIALGTADGVLRNAGAVSDALEEIAQPPSISAGTISGQWLRSTGYAAPTAQGGTQGTEYPTQPIVVQLTLDGRVVAESTVSYINTETRRTGMNPLAPSL